MGNIGNENGMMSSITQSANEKILQQNIKSYYYFKRNKTALCVLYLLWWDDDRIKINIILFFMEIETVESYPIQTKYNINMWHILFVYNYVHICTRIQIKNSVIIKYTYNEG